MCTTISCYDLTKVSEKYRTLLKFIGLSMKIKHYSLLQTQWLKQQDNYYEVIFGNMLDIYSYVSHYWLIIQNK